MRWQLLNRNVMNGRSPDPLLNLRRARIYIKSKSMKGRLPLAMAYYARSVSPPPRQPSPEPVHTPLPSPHLRARDRLRSGTGSRSPLVPPGLVPPPRTLTQSKSCSHLSPEAEAARRSEQASRLSEPQTLRRRVRSNLEANPGAVHLDSASSSRTSSTASPTGSMRRTQRRLTSINLPSTPTASPSREPPVPPMPDSGDQSPTLKDSKDSSSFDIAPIFLPELHQLSPVSDRSSLSPEKKPSKRPSVISLKGMGSRGGGSPSPTDKTHHRNIGVTCLKFFSLHKSAARVGRSQAAAHAQ